MAKPRHEVLQHINEVAESGDDTIFQLLSYLVEFLPEDLWNQNAYEMDEVDCSMVRLARELLGVDDEL